MDEEKNVIQEFLREVKLGTENILSVAKEVSEEGEKLTTIALQNRQLQPEPPAEPALARSPKRSHVFHDALGCGRYLARYGGANTIVLADVGHRRMVAVLDETETHGFETIRMEPRVHPLFAGWYELCDKTSKVQNLAQYLLEHRREIVAPDAMTLLADFSQLRGTAKITTEVGTMTARKHHCINGLMVETTIQGENQKDLVELPDSITVEAPLYLGTAPLQFTFDLTLRVDPETHDILAKLTSCDLAAAEVAAFAEMMDQIETYLATLRLGTDGQLNPDGPVVTYGSVQYESWDCVRK